MYEGTATIPPTGLEHAPVRRAASRRLLSSAEMPEVLADAVERPSAPQAGTAWRDLRVLSISLRAQGEAHVPAAAFYSLASFTGPGELTLRAEKDRTDAVDGPNAMVVSGPGRSFSLRSGQPQRGTWVCLEPRLIAAAAAECGRSGAPAAPCARVVPVDGVYRSLLKALAEQAKLAPYPLQELIVESIASALAHRLITLFVGVTASAESTRGALNLRAFRNVCAYVEQHLDERLSLERLSRVAGVSRFHFARQFRLRTGESPMGFLLRARIERGKRLLRETAASVGDVAAALGFADQSHFTRTFKRVVGVPPSAYKGRRSRAS